MLKKDGLCRHVAGARCDLQCGTVSPKGRAQYGGKFCQVIDNYNPRAEALIDDFKGEGTNDELSIAISVDMLDTGIDVPEIVNLVFAKPVKSRVKFWQMTGRGTRLCEDLFGKGQDKTVFRIFDHCGHSEESRFKQVFVKVVPPSWGDAVPVADLSAELLSLRQADALRQPRGGAPIW